MKFYYDVEMVIRPVKGTEEEQKKNSYRQPGDGVQHTEEDTPKEFFKSLQKEYGKCTSPIYVDDIEGNTKRVGWVFVKRGNYDDTHEQFLQETWVTWLDRCPSGCHKGFVMHSIPETPTAKEHENECSIQDNPL